MNKLILLLFLFPLLISGQIQIDSSTYLVTYREIVEIDLPKDRLKKESEKWFAVNFTDSEDVIRLSNEDNIIGKGYFMADIQSGKYVSPTKFKLTLDIAFKEGRLKLEMYDLVQSIPNVDAEMPVFYNPILNMANIQEYTLYKNQFIDNEQLRSATVKFVEKGKIDQDYLKLSLSYEKEILSKVEQNLLRLSTSLKSHLIEAAKKDGW